MFLLRILIVASVFLTSIGCKLGSSLNGTVSDNSAGGGGPDNNGGNEGGGGAPASDCNPGYVLVPGDAALGSRSSDFCLSKYEMKAVLDADSSPVDGKALGVAAASTHTPQSRAQDLPWGAMNLATSISECASLGSEYHLVTNAEWMTVARNIESVPSNWSGGAIGNGHLNTGHSDGWANAGQDFLAASTDDNDACFGTNNPNCLNPLDNDYWQKRTHTLSNGEIIWDLAGNMNSWVDIDGAGGLISSNCCGAPWAQYYQLNEQNSLDTYATMDLLDENGFLPLHLATYGATDLDDLGLGILNKADSATSGRGIYRGGHFSETLEWENRIGIFSAWQENLPTVSWNQQGFRCVHDL